MRQIKFRGKNSATGEWIYRYYTLIDEISFIIQLDGTYDYLEPYDTISGMVEIDSKTVGEFTGLKDKNDVEIYEGDIVKLRMCHETKSDYISPVWFNYAGARVNGHPTHIKMGIGGGRQLYQYLEKGFLGQENKCEVIGNLYENPELNDK